MSTALVSEWTARATDPRLAAATLERRGLLLAAESTELTGNFNPGLVRRIAALFGCSGNQQPVVRSVDQALGL